MRSSNLGVESLIFNTHCGRCKVRYIERAGHSVLFLLRFTVLYSLQVYNVVMQNFYRFFFSICSYYKSLAVFPMLCSISF